MPSIIRERPSESDHEPTQKRNRLERARVDVIVHCDHARTPNGDAKSAEAEQPPTELAGGLPKFDYKADSIARRYFDGMPGKVKLAGQQCCVS